MKFNTETVKKNNISENVLPIESFKSEIVESVRGNPTTILVGETGSGKTTKTPLYLLDAFPDANIAITSPRVLPARSVSKYVAEQIGETVGETVGLVTREIQERNKKTKCTFMTEGVLLNMLRKDSSLSDLDIVFIDEAHERNLNTDFILGLLKQAQETRKEKGMNDLKILVASATIEEEKFVNYFENAPLVKVPGRLFPVDISYVNPDYIELQNVVKPEKNYLFAIIKVIKDILDNSKKEGDILVFLPGEAEILFIKRELENRFGNEESGYCEFLPLFGNLNPEDQDKIFQKNSRRKVILSTNIAETSVTIDTVKHVIDSGLVKMKDYDPHTGISSLTTQNTSKASMNQRSGRAGRVSSGDCYRIMSEDVFERLDEFTKPEILRSNLSEVILKMKDIGVHKIESFDFIDKPDINAIKKAINELINLQALDEDENITEIGKEMVELPIRPDLSRSLLEARNLGCLSEMIIISAMMSTTKQLFFKIKEDSFGYYEKTVMQNALKVKGSDYFTALKVWNDWEKEDYSFEFAKKYSINIKALLEAGRIRDSLLRILGNENLVEEEVKNDLTVEEKITKCLLISLPTNLLYESQSYSLPWVVYSSINEDNAKKQVSIFPGSSCFKMYPDPKILLVDDLYENEKGILYARRVHDIKKETLSKLSPDLNGKLDNYLDSKQNPSFGFRRNFEPIEVIKDSDYFISKVKILNGLSAEDLNTIAVNKLKEYSKRDKEFRRSFSKTELYKNINSYYSDYYFPDQISKDLRDGLFNDEESYKKIVDKYLIKIEDYISNEQIEEIERLSPDTISIYGFKLPVIYSILDDGIMTATLEINNEILEKILKNNPSDEILNIKFPLADKTIFRRKNGYYDSVDFVSFKNLIDNYKNLNQKKNYESSELEKEMKDKLSTDKIEKIGKKVESKENRDVLLERFLMLKTLINLLGEKNEGNTDKKLVKQITENLLSFKKSIRSFTEELSSSDYKNLATNDIMTFLKRVNQFFTQSDIAKVLDVSNKEYLKVFLENVKKLQKVALEGDANLSMEINERIFRKAFDFVSGNNLKLIDENQAMDEIIELL